MLRKLRENIEGESNATTTVWEGTMEKSAFEPHPEGQQEFSSHAGTNVHAWGHEAPQCSLSFQSNDGDILSAILLVTFVKNATCW